MKFKNKDSKLGIYIAISVIIHLFIIFFFPFGSLRGVADEGGYGNRNFGFVQFVEIETTVKTENKTITNKQKQNKQTKKKEEEKKTEEKNEVDKKETENDKTKAEKDVQKNKSNISIKEDNKPDQKEKSVQKENTVDKQKNVNKQETESTKSQEVLTSEESDLKIEKQEKKEEEINKQESTQTNDNDKKNTDKNENIKEEEPPPPPPPPTAGELIGLSPKPVYPKYLVSEQKTGTVELNVQVNQDGKVNDVKVIKSSEIETMDRNAVLTIKNGWQFKNYKKSYSINLIVDYQIDQKGNTKVNVEIKNIKFK